MLCTEQVSVIVPIYKVEPYLDKCITSIAQQTYPNLEIILVDDGSPDHCPEICDRWAGKDDRIRVIHKENGGLSSARNAGLRMATGEFVLYVDSDDYIEPDSCQRLLAAIQPDVDFVVGGFREEKDGKTIVHGHTGLEDGKAYPSREFLIRSIRKNEWYTSACLSLYRRSFLLDNALFYKEGIFCEDTQLMLRMYLCAGKIACISYPFYHYIVRSGSIMTSGKREVMADTIVKIYDEWMDVIAGLEDPELQRYLYGIMLRFYLRNCRVWKIRTWRMQGVDFRFAMKYALDYKERLKILGFTFLKDIYLSLE